MNDSMSQDDLDQTPPADELSMLKERARTMGIPISGNIGVDTLRERINTHLNGEKDTPEDELDEELEGEAVDDRPLTKVEKEQKFRREIRAEHMALVRCRIYNLNPAKRDLPGEIFTVANRYLGTVSKYIPFGEATDNGYHIPKVLYDNLKDRKFQQVRTKKIPGTNQIEVTRRMVPEYNLEIMPALTEEELADLALKQAAAARLSAE